MKLSRSIYWKITVPFTVIILAGMTLLGVYTANSTSSSLIPTIIAAIAIVTLLVVTAAAVIAAVIIRPVRQMTRTAEGLAAGRLGEQIAVRGDDEIGRLGRALNEM